MDTMTTHLIPGISGKLNQFQVSSAFDEIGGIAGIQVRVIKHGDERDLTTANLVQMLKIEQYQTGTKYAQENVQKYIYLIEKWSLAVTFSVPNPKPLRDMSIAAYQSKMTDILPTIAKKME